MTPFTRFWTDVEKYLTTTDLDSFHLLARVYTNERSPANGVVKDLPIAEIATMSFRQTGEVSI
jgi:hypothetical protein